jgi:two-component sensor histidine kinase
MNKEERKQFVLENLIYLVIWIVVFADPVFRSTAQGDTDFYPIAIWHVVMPFFALFLLNNYLLVPKLLFRKHYAKYILAALIAIFIFAAYPYVNRIDKITPPHIHQHDKPPLPHFQHKKSADKPTPHLRPPHAGANFMIMNKLLIATLMLGFNAAIKLMFKSIRDEQQLKYLQQLNLQTELNYLKIQISPHFFMNTLNNIHALIDQDPTNAKNTVIELSKIMRYVLYDADKTLVTLEQELLFIRNYVALMKIRFTHDVDVKLDIPTTVPAVTVPPLLFFTLVENAFKHGVSYNQQSFIHISLQINQQLLLCYVKNTTHQQNIHKQSGLGLDNLKKRLNLLYHNNYTLDIDNNNNIFHVTLIIPLTL